MATTIYIMFHFIIRVSYVLSLSWKILFYAFRFDVIHTNLCILIMFEHNITLLIYSALHDMIILNSNNSPLHTRNICWQIFF